MIADHLDLCPFIRGDFYFYFFGNVGLVEDESAVSF